MAYALEARRRIKEQMNKRKPDDEFANINLSYFDTEGKEVTVYCPESRDIDATQRPARKALALKGESGEVSTEPREQKKIDAREHESQTVEPAVWKRRSIFTESDTLKVK